MEIVIDSVVASVWPVSTRSIAELPAKQLELARLPKVTRNPSEFDTCAASLDAPRVLDAPVSMPTPSYSELCIILHSCATMIIIPCILQAPQEPLVICWTAICQVSVAGPTKNCR